MLPFGLSLEDLLTGVSKLRNRVIGRFFKEIGYIEQWGSGVQRMIKSCIEAGLPKPLFQEIGLNFRVTLFLKQKEKPSLDKINKEIIELIKESNGASTSEIAKKLEMSDRAIRNRINYLFNSGLIYRFGKNPNDPQNKYF